MRVSNILQTLNWRKIGQRQHQGRRQVVWELATTPNGGVVEVLQPKTQSQQEISIPTIPTTPVSETFTSKSIEVVNNENINSESENQNLPVKPMQSEGSTPDSRPEPRGIDRAKTWSNYPHPSKDRRTIENRGNKVRERILNCNNSGELIKLYACGKITAAEIDWLRENYLTSVQCARLTEIENTQQGKILKQNPFLELKEQITKHAKRIGWTQENAIAYMRKHYGVTNRIEMSIAQLTDLRDRLAQIA
ncbi:MAG: hypothetical protein QNJ72_40510 [Pleurocapsa sp. MO_226.B13]|nr:hypothetical protein [Pleurocapsa sp. MO_226.B13]